MHMSAIREMPWSWEPPKAEFHSVFDPAPVGVAQCSLSGQITALNPALEHRLGSALDWHKPVLLNDLIEPEGGGEAERQISDVLNGKCESVRIEAQRNHATQGAVCWTAWRIAPRNGSAGSVLAMVEEIQRPTQFEQRLQQAARLEAVGKLAGGIAHDFNNVLTGVLLNCDLLMASLDPGKRAHKYAEEIRKAALQANGLVSELLGMTRPHHYHSRPLSLNEIAEGMRTLLVRLVGENIQLQFCLDANLGTVKLDATQARQIVLNLVLNARDALPAGGHIIVETRNCKLQALSESVVTGVNERSLPCALFAVQDDGCGMDEATRAHMFEPFFTTKAGKGTGLGLATVHEIVISNGGLTHVASEPAQGTRVSVFLPLTGNTEPVLTSPSEFHTPEKGEVPSSENEE